MARAMLTVMRKGILPELSNFYCHPGKAGGSPFAIGGLAVYLASSQSSYMTGQTLAIDGGHSVTSMWPFVPKEYGRKWNELTIEAQ